MTCTAMASVILQPPGQCGASKNSGEAEHIAEQNIGAQEQPLPLLKKGKALEGVAGKSRVRTAEADRDQQTPVRVEQDPLGRIDQEESQYEATREVDQERAVGERSRKIACHEAAEKITGAGADDCAQSYPQIVHDGVLQQSLIGVISPVGGYGELHRRLDSITEARGWRDARGLPVQLGGLDKFLCSFSFVVFPKAEFVAIRIAEECDLAALLVLDLTGGNATGAQLL